MNYFITTTSEQVLIRVKTGEYSDVLVCSFSADNALAAIVACEAFNKAHLMQHKAEAEMQPGEYCKQCGNDLPAGYQDYCSTRCLNAANHGCVEVAHSTHSCTHCDNQVGAGIGLCHQCYMAMRPM